MMISSCLHRLTNALIKWKRQRLNDLQEQETSSKQSSDHEWIHCPGERDADPDPSGKHTGASWVSDRKGAVTSHVGLSQQLTKLVKVTGSALILGGCPTEISGLPVLHFHLQRHGSQNSASGSAWSEVSKLFSWGQHFFVFIDPYCLKEMLGKVYTS